VTGQGDNIKAETDEAQPVIYPPQGLRARIRGLLRTGRVRLQAALAEEEAYGSRFLLLPLFFGLGIVLYFSLSFEPDWLLPVALCLFCAGLAYLLRRARLWCIIAGFACVVSIGALAAKWETARFAVPMVETYSARRLTVRILHIEDLGKGGARLLAETMPDKGKNISEPSMLLLLKSAHLPPRAALGGGLSGLVFLRPFSGPIRPQGYDFAFQNYFRAIGGQGNFAGMPQIAPLPPPDLWQRASLWLTDLRAQISVRIIAAMGPQRGPMAAALITGERAGIAKTDSQALRQAGLAHILAISGLHMAMVAGLIMLVCRKILGLFPVFTSRFAAKKAAAFCALIVAAFYLALSGAAIAAARSFIMVAVMLIAVQCDRRALSLRNLALAGCVLMLWRPHEIMGPSFQMSFAATAALIAGFNAWADYLRRRREAEAAAAAAAGRRAPKPNLNRESKWHRHIHGLILCPILSTCAASIVAGAAGGVYSAYHFNNTAPFGLISNVLALPVMSVMVMPFAVLGIMLMLLHLEYFPLQIMGAGIFAVLKIAHWVADFSPQGNLGFIPPAALALLTFGMAALMFLHTKLRHCGWLIMAAGITVYAFYPPPLALTAENGRMAAVLGADKMLYVNAKRADQFTARIWQTSYAAKEIILPQQKQAGEAGAAAENGQFSCSPLYCRVRLRNGMVLAVADMAENQAAACAEADIIILNFMAADHAGPAAKTACAGKTLINQRDLALFGAAEIRPVFRLWPLSRSNKGGSGAADKRIKLIWAVGAPSRPWNSYRRYSKRARDIPA